jgi:hypothetical protein
MRRKKGGESKKGEVNSRAKGEEMRGRERKGEEGGT